MLRLREAPHCAKRVATAMAIERLNVRNMDALYLKKQSPWPNVQWIQLMT